MMPAPPSPSVLLGTTQASRTQLQCPAPVLKSRGPYLSCRPHPCTPALWQADLAGPLGWLESQDGQEGTIPMVLPACLLPTNVRGIVAGAWGRVF